MNRLEDTEALAIWAEDALTAVGEVFGRREDANVTLTRGFLRSLG